MAKLRKGNSVDVYVVELLKDIAIVVIDWSPLIVGGGSREVDDASGRLGCISRGRGRR